MAFSEWVIYLWNLRFLPLHVRWPILKWRYALPAHKSRTCKLTGHDWSRRILHPESPLRLRYTLRAASWLSHPPQRPVWLTTRLLWPFPAWRFPAVAPGPPSELLKRRDRLIERADDLIVLRRIPLWRWRDSPQRSLYRMYEAVVVDSWPMLQYEVEYFWKHGDRRWATANLYDPARDCPGPIDPQRHTIMAAIVEELVKSFEWRLSLGLRRKDPASMLDHEQIPLTPETLPAWPGKVPALPEMLPLQTCEDEEMAQRNLAKGNAFIRRNVSAWAGEFYTV